MLEIRGKTKKNWGNGGTEGNTVEMRKKSGSIGGEEKQEEVMWE